MCRLTVPLELLIVKLLNELAERVQLKKNDTFWAHDLPHSSEQNLILLATVVMAH
jgi:hypothetical protein